MMTFEKPKKSEFWKKEKKCWRYHHFTWVPKTGIIWGPVPEIRSETDRTFCHFRARGNLPPPLNNPENQNFEKMKKNHLIISFYTIGTKNHDICYTAPEIWCATDVIFIFHFGLFFTLLPIKSLKNENVKKMKKCLEKSSFYTSVPKIMIICYTVPEICRP